MMHLIFIEADKNRMNERKKKRNTRDAQKSIQFADEQIFVVFIQIFDVKWPKYLWERNARKIM